MKYRVQYARTVVVYFQVEADSLADAENRAQELEDSGSLDFAIIDHDKVYLPYMIEIVPGGPHYYEFNINSIENDNGYWNVTEDEDEDYAPDGGN